MNDVKKIIILLQRNGSQFILNAEKYFVNLCFLYSMSVRTRIRKEIKKKRGKHKRILPRCPSLLNLRKKYKNINKYLIKIIF